MAGFGYDPAPHRHVPVPSCFVGALMGTPVSAQVGGANVGGAITDDSGAVLPGVTITVTNTATGRTHTLITELTSGVASLEVTRFESSGHRCGKTRATVDLRPADSWSIGQGQLSAIHSLVWSLPYRRLRRQTGLDANVADVNRGDHLC